MGMPGTKFYLNDTVCPPSKMCTRNCNYMNYEWCYVEPGCDNGVGVHSSTLFDGAAYSYSICKNPEPSTTYCDTSDACHCLYKYSTIPEAAAKEAGNPLYGSSCEVSWDSLPGTKYYK